MRNYYLKNLEFAGYRKYGPAKQTLEAAYPDYVTPGSGLNVIVGSIGSGKTSLLELLGLVNGQGMFDRDRLAINDGMEGVLPSVSATFISPGHASIAAQTYPLRVDFTMIGRRVQESYENDLSALEEVDRPNQSQQMKYIRANRTFKGQVEANGGYPGGPRILEAIDVESRTETINLTGIADVLLKPSTDGVSNIEQFRQKLQHFSHIGLGIEDIRMSEPQRGEQAVVHFEAKVTDGNWHNVQDLSDGTKELICWIYELNFGDSSNHKIVCIDEIERSLHPQIQTALLEVIRERATHQQFFITTHSIHIADPHVAERIHRISKTGVLKTVTKSDFPSRSIFTIDHRRTFFGDEALFVEGVDDLSFFTLKLGEYGYPELISRVFILGGKGNTEKFELTMKALNINFHAIVDDDFSDKANKLNSDKRRFLEKVVSNIGVTVDIEELDASLSTHNRIPEARKANAIEGKKYRKVNEKNIYPLKYGRLEEYKLGIDRNQNDVKVEQEDELRDIFENIKNT